MFQLRNNKRQKNLKNQIERRKKDRLLHRKLSHRGCSGQSQEVEFIELTRSSTLLSESTPTNQTTNQGTKLQSCSVSLLFPFLILDIFIRFLSLLLYISQSPGGFGSGRSGACRVWGGIKHCRRFFEHFFFSSFSEIKKRINNEAPTRIFHLFCSRSSELPAAQSERFRRRLRSGCVPTLLELPCFCSPFSNKLVYREAAYRVLYGFRLFS